MLPITFTSRLLKKTRDAATLLDVLMFVNDYGEIYELNAEQLKEAANRAKKLYFNRLWFDYCKKYEKSLYIAISDRKTIYTSSDKRKGFIVFSINVCLDDLEPQLFKDFEGYNVQVSLLSEVRGFGVMVSYDFDE